VTGLFSNPGAIMTEIVWQRRLIPEDFVDRGSRDVDRLFRRMEILITDISTSFLNRWSPKVGIAYLL